MSTPLAGNLMATHMRVYASAPIVASLSFLPYISDIVHYRHLPYTKYQLGGSLHGSGTIWMEWELTTDAAGELPGG